MRRAKIFFCILATVVGVSLRGHPHVALTKAQGKPGPVMGVSWASRASQARTGRRRSAAPTIRRVVIAAGTLFDGKGRVLRNTRVVIEGAKIVALDPKAGPVDYDLRGLTVMPGWIDAHVHITWSFGKDGKNAG